MERPTQFKVSGCLVVLWVNGPHDWSFEAFSDDTGESMGEWTSQMACRAPFSFNEIRNGIDSLHQNMLDTRAGL